MSKGKTLKSVLVVAVFDIKSNWLLPYYDLISTFWNVECEFFRFSHISFNAIHFENIKEIMLFKVNKLKCIFLLRL